jgi:hypothetical protein
MVAVDPSSVFGRRGTVTVSWPGGSQSIDVTEGCTVPTRTDTVTADQQHALLSVGSPCSFTSGLSIDAPWITFVGTHGGGSQLDFIVDHNTGPGRTGQVTGGWGQGQYTIIQAAGGPPNCVTAIAPTGQAFDEKGGTGSFTVTAPPSCYWEASVHGNLLSNISGNSGTGTGVVTFKAGNNPFTVDRKDYLLVGGTLQFQLTQRACPTVSPLSFHVPAAGGSFSTTVTGNCLWSDITNDSFITRSLEQRSGSGIVAFSVAPNQTGQPRSGSLAVANQTVVVTQDP